MTKLKMLTIALSLAVTSSMLTGCNLVSSNTPKQGTEKTVSQEDKAKAFDEDKNDTKSKQTTTSTASDTAAKQPAPPKVESKTAPVPEPPKKTYRAHRVTSENMGQYITVTVRVQSYKNVHNSILMRLQDVDTNQYFKGYMNYKLTNANNDRFAVIQEAARTGNAIHVEGVVGEYKGQLQLTVKRVYQ